MMKPNQFIKLIGTGMQVIFLPFRNTFNEKQKQTLFCWLSGPVPFELLHESRKRKEDFFAINLPCLQHNRQAGVKEFVLGTRYFMVDDSLREHQRFEKQFREYVQQALYEGADQLEKLFNTNYSGITLAWTPARSSSEQMAVFMKARLKAMGIPFKSLVYWNLPKGRLTFNK